MKSVLQEIEKIRNNSAINVVDSFINRYTVLLQESNRLRTAYSFGVPIYNIRNGKIVDLRFHHTKQESVFIGSEARISISDRIKLFNQHGLCNITLQGALSKKTEDTVFFTNNMTSYEVRPTLNGIILTFECASPSYQPQIRLHFDHSFVTVLSNNKFFSVMREKFIPFITVSCIGALNVHEKVIAPCEVHYQKINDSEYVLSFFTTNKSHKRVAVEINMQETKLFQDTTVESNNPTMNNAFGGISFLGTSKLFGEQLLYSRLEISNIAQLQSKKIISAILHIPKLGYNPAPLTIKKIAERFCSFGSNWENKIAITDTIALSSESNGYYHLNMTKLLGNFRKKSENFVILGNSKKSSIIPTGDSFHTPQILEVRYQ